MMKPLAYLTSLTLVGGIGPTLAAPTPADAERWINISAAAVDDAILVVQMDDRTLVRRPHGADVWLQYLRVTLGNPPTAHAFDVMNQFRINCKDSTAAMIGRLEAGVPAPPLPRPAVLDGQSNICAYLNRRGK